MIYTVTLNPALDYIMYPENLAAGEINRSSRESLYFGGKGINVSFILNELGIPSVATGFIAGFTGSALESAASAFAITDFVKLEKGITRINVKLRAENPRYRIRIQNAFLKSSKKHRRGIRLYYRAAFPKAFPQTFTGK